MARPSLRPLRWSSATLAFVGVVSMAAAPGPRAAGDTSGQSLSCLAANIYHEARGEPREGQRAVADVTLNRVDDRRWPNTLCEVVWQPKQFSWTHDHLSDEMLDPVARRTAFEVAWEALTTPRVYDATHYHAAYSRPYWAAALERLYRIGNHIFYKE